MKALIDLYNNNPYELNELLQEQMSPKTFAYLERSGLLERLNRIKNEHHLRQESFISLFDWEVGDVVRICQAMNDGELYQFLLSSDSLAFHYHNMRAFAEALNIDVATLNTQTHTATEIK